MRTLVIIINFICFWSHPFATEAIAKEQAENKKEGVNFYKDIAPIIYSHCAPCHRDGMAAPFNLLTYDDVRKRSQQITEVIESKYMPPWLPEPGHGNFNGSRRLTEGQIALIKSGLMRPKGF